MARRNRTKFESLEARSLMAVDAFFTNVDPSAAGPHDKWIEVESVGLGTSRTGAHGAGGGGGAGKVSCSDLSVMMSAHGSGGGGGAGKVSYSDLSVMMSLEATDDYFTSLGR